MKKFIILLLLFFVLIKNIYSNDIISEDIVPSLSLPAGFSISIFCYGLGSPYMMAFDKQDNLLITVPKRGAVVALPDRNNDGKADRVINVFNNLDSPSGIDFDLFDDKLYVATAKKIVKAIYNSNTMEVYEAEELKFNLPFEDREVKNHALKKSKNKIFISIFAPCNTCNLMDKRFGSILQLDENDGNEIIFSNGLRLPAGLAFNKKSSNVWTTDTAPDGLNENLAADELNQAVLLGFYGWPYCYEEINPNPNISNACKNINKSAIKFPYNSNPYGLVFYYGNLFPGEYKGDLFVALHGKKGKKEGFKIVRLIFENNRPLKSKDFITGWISPSGEIKGMPIDIAINSKGEMFISDDYSGVVYKVIYNEPQKK
ncbi:PQQ-dependent sugar dehydrogenase [Candidatus Poribacteria bacterium]|nr:PQQ-dependent sugar dehydrogenase [Candidatus Poribacteria bacterium]